MGSGRSEVVAELKPPPGFVLDTPPPPPGFQLDNPSSQASPTEPRSIGGFARNVVSSGGNFIGNVANAVLHPIDTGKGVLDAAAGGISKMAGTGQYFPQQVQSAEAIGNAYKQRYGSLENIGNTLYNDPVGAAADASALLSGGSALAGGTGAIAKTLNLPRVASAMDTTANAARVAGDVSNPISFPGRMVKNTGSITKALGEGTSSAGFPSASRALENTGQSIENLGSGKATRNMAGYSSNRLWQSAMKPQNFPALDVNDRRRIISTMQREDIPLSMGVVDEVDRRIEAVNAKIAKGIAERTEQGAEIDPTKVAPYADQVRARFQDVNPETAQNAISSVKAEYLRKHSIEAPYTKIKPTAQSGFAAEPGRGADVSVGRRGLGADRRPMQSGPRRRGAVWLQGGESAC